MRVNGKITHTSTEVVDVDPLEVLKNIKCKWMLDREVSSYWYINSEGCWEDWEDTHSSGITTTHRPATEQEVTVWKAFKDIESLAVQYK